MQRKKSRAIWFILLIVFIFCGWWIKASFFSQSIRFDLRRADVSKQFEVSNAQRADSSDRGLRLACPQPCSVMTAIKSHTWEEFPYVKIRVTESSVPSAEMLLACSASSGAARYRRLKLAGSERMYVASAKSFRPWEQEMPWRGQIDWIGAIIVSGTVSISEISLADSLTPWEWILFSSNELNWVEPLLPYSVNILWGASIDGWSLTIIGGSLAILLLLIAICGKNPRTGQTMLCLVIGLVLLMDAPFLASLVHTVKIASTQSAWRSGREEEERSRFGSEYADLARTLRHVAPIGSTVFIPSRQQDRILGESEWITFQLWPQYKIATQIEYADYIILLHPTEAKFDSGSSTLILPSQNRIRVNPLLSLKPDVMLFKRQHD
jgi:hypothetical protein